MLAGVRGRGSARDLESLIKAAEAARQSGWLAQAREGFVEAATTAGQAGDVEALVRAALGAGGLWVNEHRDVVARATAQSIWERARQVARSGSIEEARLEVRLLAEAAYGGASAEPIPAAVAGVRAFGDDVASAEALSLWHHLLLGPRNANGRLDVAEEILRLGARSRDALTTVVGLCWRTVDLFLLGDPRAGQSLQELRERGTSIRCEAVSFIADVLGSMVLARAGRLAEAESAATSALARGERVGDPDAQAYHGAMLAALRWWQGRVDEISDQVRIISTSPRLGYHDHVYVAADAVLSATAGDIDSAEEALSRLSAIGLDKIPDSSNWMATQFLATEAAYLMGAADVATAAAELLSPYRNLPVMPSLAVVCLGSAERALGLAAATGGRIDSAVDHLEAALRADRALGSRPMATVTEHTLAAILRARGKPGDEAQSRQLAQRAEDRARSIGMALPRHPSWLGTRVVGAVMASATRQAWLQRDQARWRVELDGHVIVLGERVGMGYLAELVSHPGQDIDVLSLASRGILEATTSRDTVVDRQALRAYRHRARELAASLSTPDISSNDASRNRAELSALLATVRSATSLNGRLRAFPANHERARTAVRKALLRAVDAIAEIEPDLGQHLRSGVVTGATCRYNPSPGWAVTVRSGSTAAPSGH